MRTPSRARLLAGAAMIAICGASPVLAQSAQDPQDATEVEEIVITGIAAALETAIAEKRRATSIVEVIAAEDLGKLPDQSIAESLARLPGLAAQRIDGRAQVISIRGLGPDFTTALLNGREQVTTGDNRGVEFDQFPSELLSGVIVYKTPDAALAAQGLAGTADLQTVRPLEYGRRAGAINYRYEWNDLGSLNAGAEDTGHRISASFVDQFMDDTLGVALGVAYMETPYQNERYNAWGYPSVETWPAYIQANPAAYAGAVGQAILGGAKPYAQSGLIERTGVMGVVEWAPNDRFRATADVFYSEFENTQILRGIEIPLWWGDASREQLQPNYTVTDGLITQATFNGVRGVVRNDLNTREAETTSLGLRLEYDLTDNWAVSLDINSSSVDRTDQVIESYSGYGYNFAGATDNITYTLDNRGVASFRTNLDYTDATRMVLTDPRGWGGSQIQAGYLNSPITEDELNAVRLATTYTFDGGLIRSIEAGANFTSRDKSFVSDEFFLIPSGGATSRPIPTDCLLEPTSIGFLGFSMISYDTRCVLDSGALAQQRNANFDVVSKNWEVSEDVINVFVKANLEGSLGPIPFTGNAGLQMIDVDQSSNGFAATSQINGVSSPVSGGVEYRDFLPSLNLIFELSPSDVLRFAAARVQARPRMDQMRASRTYGFNEQNRNSTNINAAYFNGGGGNPELRPWEADILDVSYEHYFTSRSYVSIAGFLKDLKTYIYNQNVVQDFSGLNYPTAAGQGVPASFFGLYNSPQNGTGGTIEGVEVAASLALGDFISPLEGFGIVASWADTSSDIQPEPGNPSRPIEGLSEQVANVTVYYERDGFSARVSNRYRSEFLGEVAGFGNGRTFRTVADENVVDAQIGYEFQSGPLEGLSVLLQGNNLTDEEFVTLNNNLETQPIDYQVYGSTYLIGINYRF